MIPRPLWIPTELDEAFKNTVVKAFTTPHVYHPKYAPLPWAVGLYGRPGMEKMEVMESLCLRYGLLTSVTKVDVKLGETGKALDMIWCTAAATALVLKEELQFLPEGEIAPQKVVSHIILINHADILCYEPDSEQSLLRSIELKNFCQSKNVLFIAIFDRLPGETHGQTTTWVREATNKFFKQFDAQLYIEPPNEEFRIKLFKYYIEDFVTYYNDTHKVALPLNIEDYEPLAPISTFATPDNILTFLKNIFSKLVHVDLSDSEDFELLKNGITLEYIETFTNNAHGAPHICDYDTSYANDAFATGVGRGPKARRKKKTLEKKDDLTNVTGFNEKNVDADNVWSQLHLPSKEDPPKVGRQTKKRKTKKIK